MSFTSLGRCLTLETLPSILLGSPRETRTYLLQQVLSPGFGSARTDILIRYAKFFQNLRRSTSKEVAMLANLVSRDLSCTTGANLRVVEEALGLCPWDTGKERLRAAVIDRETVTLLEEDKWRVPC